MIKKSALFLFLFLNIFSKSKYEKIDQGRLDSIINNCYEEIISKYSELIKSINQDAESFSKLAEQISISQQSSDLSEKELLEKEIKRFQDNNFLYNIYMEEEVFPKKETQIRWLTVFFYYMFMERKEFENIKKNLPIFFYMIPFKFLSKDFFLLASKTISKYCDQYKNQDPLNNDYQYLVYSIIKKCVSKLINDDFFDKIHSSMIKNKLLDFNARITKTKNKK
jgi:hypothetical protein